MSGRRQHNLLKVESVSPNTFSHSVSDPELGGPSSINRPGRSHWGRDAAASLVKTRSSHAPLSPVNSQTQSLSNSLLISVVSYRKPQHDEEHTESEQ